MAYPSVWVLRKSTDDFPEKSACKNGDFIVLYNGDILVFIDQFWDLLPGRYLDMEGLKLFIEYVRNGWPDDVEMVRSDLTGKISDKFIDRMCQTVEKMG